MNELKAELHNLVDSIDNHEILENLAILLKEYVNYYLPVPENEAD